MLFSAALSATNLWNSESVLFIKCQNQIFPRTRNELLQLPERQDGPVFSPSRTAASQAVTIFTEKEETWINGGLTREGVRGKAFDSWLGDPIHETKMFVPSFVPWANLTLQIVNEGSVRPENLGELGLCIIDPVPIITVVSSAWINTSEYRKKLPSN